MNFDYSQISNNPEALGQVVGAIIGVAGLVIGTIITIFTSLIIRNLDIRRENRREDAMIAQEKRQKEYRLRRQIYTEFLNRLSDLEELLIQKKYKGDIEDLHQYWSNMAIKLELVAGEAVKTIIENFENSLFKLAESSLKGKLDANEYTANRAELMKAIRQDMDLN